MTPAFWLFLIVAIIVVLFIWGWRVVPKGYLTKITSTVSLTLITTHQVLQDNFALLRDAVPPEAWPYFVAGFLVLNIAAALRPDKAVR